MRPAEPVIVTSHWPDVFGRMRLLLRLQRWCCRWRVTRTAGRSIFLFSVASRPHPMARGAGPAGFMRSGAASSMSRAHLASRPLPCASASPPRSLSSPCAGPRPAISRRSPAGWIIRAGPLERPSPGPRRPAHESLGGRRGGTLIHLQDLGIAGWPNWRLYRGVSPARSCRVTAQTAPSASLRPGR